MSDILQSRILGAVRFIDVSTGAAIRKPLKLTSETVAFLRNLSGDYAIAAVQDDELMKHVASYPDALPAPQAESKEFSALVKDPSGEYLPLRFILKLPRVADPTKAAQGNSIFRAFEVKLLSSPSRPIGANWCVIRVSVEHSVSKKPVPQAGVRVIRDNDAETAIFGMTDDNGDAMVAFVGHPFLITSTDPNDANNELIKPDAAGKVEVFGHKQGQAVYPHLIAANDANLIPAAPVDIRLTAGREVAVKVSITIP